MNQQSEEMRLYFNRVRPMCRELFAMAFAICADYEDAEYALQRVILSGWNGGRRLRSLRSFREQLRSEMRRAALERARNSAEDDWDQYGAADDGIEDEDPIVAAIQHEDAEIRRIAMLRYGCMLNSRQTARIMDMSAGQVEQLLSRFQRRLKRRLDSDRRRKLESQLKEVCQAQLAEGGVEMPDIGALYRNFEAEASASYSQVGHYASRIFVFIVTVALLTALAFVMWGVAAVIRPAQIEDSGLIVETLDEQ